MCGHMPTYTHIHIYIYTHIDIDTRAYLGRGLNYEFEDARPALAWVVPLYHLRRQGVNDPRPAPWPGWRPRTASATV
eukprot:6799205-Pyramimonas_sp.AAC.1